jgi:drug/metabolite transporter (DMT)-like permease
MAYGAFWFSVMSLLVKIAGQRLPSMEIVLVRAVVTLALSYALVRRARLPLWGNRKSLLLLRGFLGCAALTCFYFSIVHLPLAEATVIQYTNPVFAALLAGLLLGERFGGRELIGVIASMTGVLLIARPSFLFASGAPVDPLHVGIAVCGALFSAIAYVTVRMLRNIDSPLVVVFYFPLVTVPIVLPFAIAGWIWPTPTEWAVLVGIGTATQIAQVYMTRGLQLEPAGRATAVGYLQIVFAALWGILLLGEHPDAWSILGAAIIIGGTLLVSLTRPRAASSPSPASPSAGSPAVGAASPGTSAPAELRR